MKYHSINVKSRININIDSKTSVNKSYGTLVFVAKAKHFSLLGGCGGCGGQWR